jgi:hypothetical protein
MVNRIPQCSQRLNIEKIGKFRRAYENTRYFQGHRHDAVLTNKRLV